jgi:hypothetical protein
MNALLGVAGLMHIWDSLCAKPSNYSSEIIIGRQTCTNLGTNAPTYSAFIMCGSINLLFEYKYGYGRLVVCIEHASARVDEDGRRGNTPIHRLGKLRKYTAFVYVLLFMAGCIT